MNKTEWIKKTRERAAVMLEAAERVEAGEESTHVIGGAWVPACNGDLPLWAGSIDCQNYTLKPRRKLRHWTAKEWGARFGDEFLYNNDRFRLSKILLPRYLEFDKIDVPVVQCCAYVGDTDRITNLDGSPCGEWEVGQ